MATTISVTSITAVPPIDIYVGDAYGSFVYYSSSTSTGNFIINVPPPYDTLSLLGVKIVDAQGSIGIQNEIPPSQTPTPSITSTNTPTPTNTRTQTPTPTNTSTNTPTPTNTSTKTPTPSVTSTKTPTPTNTRTQTPTPTINATSVITHEYTTINELINPPETYYIDNGFTLSDAPKIYSGIKGQTFPSNGQNILTKIDNNQLYIRQVISADGQLNSESPIDAYLYLSNDCSDTPVSDQLIALGNLGGIFNFNNQPVNTTLINSSAEIRKNVSGTVPIDYVIGGGASEYNIFTPNNTSSCP